MKILITGATGLVGQILMEHLAQSHDVDGVSKSGNQQDVTSLDLMDKDAVFDYFAINDKYDAVIHLASLVASKLNVQDFDVFSNNNIITLNLLEGIRFMSLSKFIYFSSSSVYPNISGVFNEHSNVDPSYNTDCYYGISKLNGEAFIKHALKLKNTELAIIRMSMLYHISDDSSRILSVFKQQLESDNKITIWGDGSRLINLAHPETILLTIDNLLDKSFNGILNCSTECLSLKALAEKLIKCYGNKDSEVIYLNKAPSLLFELNTDKLKGFLND